MDYKNIIGAIAVLVAFIGYVPYFRDIFAGKTKPHAFTWLIWGSLNAIAFVGQVQDNAGAGSWAVGFTALALLSIFVISLSKGEKDIRPFDWFCIAGSALSIILWAVTSEPLTAILLITFIDALGFLPTVRKSFKKPNEETLITYLLSTIKYGLVIVALQNYTLITVIFPLSLVIMNGLFVTMLIVRRRML